MNTLESQVRILISGTSTGATTEVPQTYVRDFLTRGAEYVLKYLPSKLLLPFATETAVPDAGLALTTLRLSGPLSVRIGDNICRKVPSDRQGKLTDSSSLFFVPSTTKNPVFYEHNGKLFVAPLGSADAYAAHISFTDVASDVTTLLAGLDDAIVNYAASMASKSLYNYHVEVNEDMELAGLHQKNSADFMQAAGISVQTYVQGKGLAMQGGAKA